jgi:hypothetical protein
MVGLEALDGVEEGGRLTALAEKGGRPAHREGE